MPGEPIFNFSVSFLFGPNTTNRGLPSFDSHSAAGQTLMREPHKRQKSFNKGLTLHCQCWCIPCRLNTKIVFQNIQFSGSINIRLSQRKPASYTNMMVKFTFSLPVKLVWNVFYCGLISYFCRI